MGEQIGVHFTIRKERADAEGRAPIYLRITVNCRRAELYVQRRVYPDVWQAYTSRGAGLDPNLQELHRYLEEIRTKVNGIHRRYTPKNRRLTAKMIKERVHLKEEKHPTLLGFYKEHNLELKDLMGRETTYSTYMRHRRTRKLLKDFIEKQYRAEDIYLRDIDLRFITQFEHFLKVKRIGKQNTVTKYVVNFKKIVRIAYANDWISKNPFFFWKARWTPVEREALTEHELKLLMEGGPLCDRLEQVRDVFLFCCYTGLSYVDVERLSSQHLVIGMDGNPWISIKRGKTDCRSSIPLLPAAEQILKKYSSHKKDTTALLPVISNQKINFYLKEIAAHCNIEKKLTFHLARHTFATTVTLSNGVPIESVSRMLGHRSLKTTQIYAKVVDRKIMEDMMVIRTKYGATPPDRLKKSN